MKSEDVFGDDPPQIVDTDDPYVKAKVKKMAKGYQWEVSARVRGNNVAELLEIIRQAEQELQKEYGTQA